MTSYFPTFIVVWPLVAKQVQGGQRQIPLNFVGVLFRILYVLQFLPFS
jgi:hypothetical protein